MSRSEEKGGVHEISKEIIYIAYIDKGKSLSFKLTQGVWKKLPDYHQVVPQSFVWSPPWQCQVVSKKNHFNGECEKQIWFFGGINNPKYLVELSTVI